MGKLLIIVATLSFVYMATAEEPARRPPRGGKISYSPARAVCHDRTYMCSYNCIVAEGQICTPTRGSDSRCPDRKVTNGHWFGNGNSLVLDFEGYHDMSCQVVSHARSNIQCGMTKFGWDCWAGRRTHNE
jgi:hypothetical protein